MSVPNPGSDEAITLGCTCPVIDNRRGLGVMRDTFWIDGDCPLHATGTARSLPPAAPSPLRPPDPPTDAPGLERWRASRRGTS